VVLADNFQQITVHTLRFHIAQPKCDDARQCRSAGSHKITEIQIVGEQDPTLTPRLLQYRWIIFPIKTLIVKMNRLVSKAVEEANCLGGDTHICKELHTAADSTG